MSGSALSFDMCRLGAVTAGHLERQSVTTTLGQVSQLVEEFQKSSWSRFVGAYAQQESHLQQAMARITTPWLDAQKTMRSIAGFAELQGIGKAISNAKGFEDSLSAVLRTNLGDWRCQKSWPSDIFTDLSARSRFYEDLGFNRELTTLPAEAFDEGLGVTDLRRERPPLLALYGSPVSVAADPEQEEGFARTNMAHDWLQRLESQVRAFIDEQMTDCFGLDWPKYRLPNGMYDRWQAKKRAAQEAEAKESPIIAYADFTDYIEVICRRDNWREVFAVFFLRKESIRESFQRLYPVRRDTMHARPITPDDQLLLHVETRRLMKAVIKAL